MGHAAEKKCPYCGEMIKAEAIKCRFCAEFLEPRPTEESRPVRPEVQPPSSGSASGADAGEHFLYSGPLSKIGLVRPAIVFLLWLIAALIVAVGGAYLMGRGSAELARYKYIPILLGLSVAIIAGTWFTAKWIVFRCRVFRITKDRIESESGVFSKRVENMDMWRVKDVRFCCGVIQGILRVGSVIIESSDTSDPLMVIGPVRNARALYDVVQKAQRQADRRQGVVHIEQ